MGFKVFKLKNSNFKIWRGDLVDSADDLENQLELLKDPIKTNAKERNIVWELVLKAGYDLNASIEVKKLPTSQYYSIAGGEMAVLVSKADAKSIQELIAHKPQKIVCLDSLFEGNDQLKTNIALQMKEAGVEFRTI